MAIHPEHDYFAARATEETAAQLANRNRREERRRAERRRARVLTVSGAALGLVLMAGGLTALGSTRGAAEVGRTTPVAAREGLASPQPVAREATVPPAAVSQAPKPPVQKRAERRPASEPKKQARARSASESKRTAPKRGKPVNTAAAKPVAKPRPTSVLVRKCSAGCHPTAALLTLRFDSASAAIVTDGMVEAQGVRLTKRERAAVIAALTRK